MVVERIVLLLYSSRAPGLTLVLCGVLPILPVWVSSSFHE